MAPTVGFEPTQPFSSPGVQSQSLQPLEYVGIYGTPNENRTRISALKGRRPIPLVDESMVEQEGLEPPTPEAPDLQSGTLPITLYCSKF